MLEFSIKGKKWQGIRSDAKFVQGDLTDELVEIFPHIEQLVESTKTKEEVQIQEIIDFAEMLPDGDMKDKYMTMYPDIFTNNEDVI